MLVLDPLLDRIRPLLADHDRPVYLVGGAVRDALLGRASHDLDLIVPHGAIALTFELARRLDLPAYRLDDERDVGRLLVPGSETTVDIARYRGETLADDLRARDFTINALALPLAARTAGAIIDDHGGRADLAAGWLRVIHEHSIDDDPVRALRAIRLAAQLDLRLTDETSAAVRAAGPSLSARASAERVRDELGRLLSTGAPYDIIGALDHHALLGYVLPEVAALSGMAQSPPHHENVLAHTYSVMDRLLAVVDIIAERPVVAAWAGAVDAILSPHRRALAAHLAATVDGGYSGQMLLRWGALLHDSGKPATQTIDETGRIRFIGHDETGADIAAKLLNRLKFSGEAVRRVRAIVAGHMRPLYLAAEGRPPSRRSAYRYYRALHEAGVDVVLLSLADHLATYDGAGPDESWPALLVVAEALLDAYFTGYTETVRPARLLNGQEVMALLAIGPGKELGRLLAELEEAQAAGEVVSRGEAVAFIRARAG